MDRYFASSELIINQDGSIFHLHVRPEYLADKVILVGDPQRVNIVSSHFTQKECDIQNREFHTVTGYYKQKRITVVSTGIGCDNIDIVVNELDALANINFKNRKENDTPLRLLNWVNEYGELGGLRCTDDTSIYIIRDDHLMFCKAKDIRVGDHIPLRYGFEISIDSKVLSNSIVPYADEYVYCLENISGSDTIIINDVVVELEGAKHDNSRMAAD